MVECFVLRYLWYTETGVLLGVAVVACVIPWCVPSPFPTLALGVAIYKSMKCFIEPKIPQGPIFSHNNTGHQVVMRREIGGGPERCRKDRD